MSIALLLLATATPTLEDVQRLPPEAAGALALAAYPHAPIVEVQPVPPGILPPGYSELDMIERPQSRAGGRCIRQRWTVSFAPEAGEPSQGARAQRAIARSEIVTATGRRCPADGYVGLNQDVAVADGFAALRQLRAWRNGRRVPDYRCYDATTSGLCRTPAGMQRAIATLRPWMVSHAAGGIAIWMGTPGQMVTELRYDPRNPQVVSIDRHFPAPF